MSSSSHLPHHHHHPPTSQRTAAAGGPTQTQTHTVPLRIRPQQAVLRLRGASSQQVGDEEEESLESGKKRRQRIQWAEDVIDNEGLGRKKSKGMRSQQ